MKAGTARSPLYAAGLAMIVAAAAGCAVSSSAGAGGGSSAAPVSPLAAVKLAAKTTGKANSFTATMNVQIASKLGASSTSGPSDKMTMTFAEQLHPTMLASVNVGSLSVGGKPMPGGISEIVTPTAIYIKSSLLTQGLHLTRPWAVIPLSSLSSTGLNLSQFMDQATGNGPLADSQLLTEATSVHRVGTGSIDGVPVTEYTGTIPLSRALSHLSGAAKTMAEQLETAGGITTETFTIWVDGNNLLRKVVTAATGSFLSETSTMTITGINQPAGIVIPPASQTSALPKGTIG